MVSTQQPAAAGGVSPNPAARAGQAAGAWARRHPRLAVTAGVVLVVAVTAVADWPHRATRGQLQGDLESYATEIRGDVQSCATEVADSLSAYNQIMAGVSTDRPTGIAIADRAELDCSPAGNPKILDLAAAQSPRSLAGYRLEVGTQQLYGWAESDAVDAMQDVHALLVQPGNPTRLADLRAKLGDMQQRALSAQQVFDRTAGAVGAPPMSFGLDAIQPQVLVG